jgi:hypothetical protein
MNAARLAELHRERAALQGKLAEVDRRIADAMTEEPEEARRRPAYVVPDNVSEADRDRAAKRLRAHGHDVRPRPARRGQDGARR